LALLDGANSVGLAVGASEQRSATELEVTLAVEGLPVALGAFKWLARTAGAESVTIGSDRV
jgi:hypothetical protein